jgi:hypothetical protein
MKLSFVRAVKNGNQESARGTGSGGSDGREIRAASATMISGSTKNGRSRTEGGFGGNMRATGVGGTPSRDPGQDARVESESPMRQQVAPGADAPL